MYLQRRNGVYWFRKAIPLNLIEVLGQADIRVSLRTYRRDEARRKASVMQVALETVYAVLRDDHPLEPAKALLGGFLQDFSAQTTATSNALFGACEHNLQGVANTLAVPAQLAPAGETLVDVDHIDPLLSSEPPRGAANVMAVELLQLAMRIRRERGWSKTSRLKALVALCQKVAAAGDSISLDTPQGLQAIRTIIREEVDRAGIGTIIHQAPSFDAASLKEIVAGEVRAGIVGAGRDRWSAEPLSVMIASFLQAQYPTEENKKAASRQRKVGSKHRKDVEQRLASFLRFLGDKAVRDVARDDLKSYRDILDQLPDRFEIRFRTNDMRIAIEQNQRRKIPYPTIGPITVNLKWLGPVDRLFDWLVVEEKIEKNLVDGVRSTQEAGEAANNKRLPFKPEQISKLFAVTSASSPKSALYWLPLLMLVTGARPNELAQLHPDDLDLTFNNRPHLNVLCLLDDNDDAADPAETEKAKDNLRRVKTAAGRRMIPLHPILVEAGFVRFVEERRQSSAKKLFRELKPDQHGFWSSAITKRLNRIIRDKLNITNPKYTAYSLRHTFIDACRTANIEEATRMKFVGHQLGGVHGIYGNPRARPDESPLIDLVRFDGVDFSQYLPARY